MGEDICRLIRVMFSTFGREEANNDNISKECIVLCPEGKELIKYYVTLR